MNCEVMLQMKMVPAHQNAKLSHLESTLSCQSFVKMLNSAFYFGIFTYLLLPFLKGKGPEISHYWLTLQIPTPAMVGTG